MRNAVYFIANSILLCVTIVGATPLIQLPSYGESNADIGGVIVDGQEARVADASITIESRTVRKQITSDEEGKFHIKLPDGIYAIHVKSPGFKIYRIKKLRIKAAETKTLKIVLKVATVASCCQKCPKGRLCL